MMRILLAEDDVVLSQMISENLGSLGFVVEVSHDGLHAAEFLRAHPFDLLILDWNLPGMTGIELCTLFRKLGRNEPVLMLTSRSGIADKEEGLDSGADDYLTKPFEARELAARVKALLRRPSGYIQKVIRLGEIFVDMEARTLSRAESSLRLPPRELALLEFFMRRPGQVIGSESLLTGVWGSDFDGSEVALRSCLAKLRKALTTLGYEGVIETVHGFGYKFNPPGMS
jgi:DNA-binding response OmpR family regulator